jgi:hypothetical protein
MKLALVLHTDRFCNNEKINHFDKLDNQLENYFETKHFGNSLNEVYFGIVILSKTFKELHVLSKPRYIKSRKSFECEIEYDFENFMKIDNEDIKGFIIDGIISSLPLITEKVKDFDVVAFKNELENFKV